MLVRNALFRRVELAALRRWPRLGELEAEAGSTMSGEAWRDALEDYFEEHDTHRHRARRAGPRMLLIEQTGRAAGTSSRSSATPRATTTGGITATVDLAASDAEGALVMDVTGFGQV